MIAYTHTRLDYIILSGRAEWLLLRIELYVMFAGHCPYQNQKPAEIKFYRKINDCIYELNEILWYTIFNVMYKRKKKLKRDIQID